ncbi:MFS transporter [Microtetraspora sp. NBRC 13810]|uniref:MFS transporter n=1 Tax=Microtetraspora sp. NBRC 13810 TaxID=3030990 RepID=UPI0024A34C3E|nr:MFS transporter [Microtetraspora sp. NBRC 13810]GLW09866.1 MFS transporter [Microtetraspora sp. NBRC 13810]
MTVTRPVRLGGRHRRLPGQTASYGEVIANREFRALWLGQGLSMLGDQLAQVALAVLVFNRTGSALATAAVYSMTYLPSIVGGPLLSGLADRFARRKLMITCDLVRGLLVALMAIPGMPFGVLCVMVFCVVLISTPFSAARAALLPEILRGEQYIVGSALQNMTNQAMQVIGFAIGGALIAGLGPYRALALDAATFMASALILVSGVRRRPAPERPEGEEGRISVFRMTAAGARLVFGDRRLRTLVMFAWLCGFYVLPEGIAAPYAATLTDGSLSVPVVTGLLLAAMPTGTVIGAIVVSKFFTPAARLRSVGWMAMLSCAPLILCGLHPPLPVVLALWVVSGLGGAYQLAANAAFVQSVPANRRGQAFGLASAGLLASQGIGILLGGVLTQELGPEPVIALAGAAGLAVAGVLTLLWTESHADVTAKVPAEATT